MRIFNHLKLLQKFGLVGGLCAVFLSLSLFASVYGIRKIVTGFSTFADRDQAIALALKDMYAQGLQAEQATRNILLNPADEKAMHNYKQAREDFGNAYTVIAAKGADLPEIRSEIGTIVKIWNEAVVLQQQVQSLARGGQGTAALNLLVTDETPKWREVKAKIIKLGDDRLKKMNNAKKDIAALAGNALAVSLGLGLCTIIGSIVFMTIVVLGITRNLRKMSNMMQSVTTTWNLTHRLDVTTRDEIGELAADFNLMTERLAGMVAQVNRSSRELDRISDDIHHASKQVVSAVEQQSTGVNNTSSAMVQIIASINEVAKSVTALSASSMESASSIMEMASSVEEVAQNSESLGSSVDDVCASIIEMSASIKQVSSGTGRLLEAADTTAASIMQMDCSIKEVKKNALDSAAISVEVRQDAETGQQTVEATMAGITEIKHASKITAEVIATLSKRAKDIGSILSVIDGLAKQTNLLALNAAIIAAQAGEHGRGFAVVADEIKELSDRTSSSTREIAQVIQGVQGDTKRAVEAINRAEKSIGEGEVLSQRSSDALAKIVTGVQRTTAQTENIARATAEQANGSNMIREAMEQVSDMVKQIANATREQTTGIDLIMAALDKMKDHTSQVKMSTRQQSNAAGLISKSTENISEMIQMIKRACNEQRQGGDQISPAVADIRLSTDSNLEAIRILDKTFDSLAGEIRILGDEIDRFTVGNNQGRA